MPGDRRLPDPELAGERPPTGSRRSATRTKVRMPLERHVRSIHYPARSYALPPYGGSLLERLREGSVFPIIGSLTHEGPARLRSSRTAPRSTARLRDVARQGARGPGPRGGGYRTSMPTAGNRRSDRADFPSLAPDARLMPVAASRKAFEGRRADRGCRSRDREAPMGRCPDPPVPPLVVRHGRPSSRAGSTACSPTGSPMASASTATGDGATATGEGTLAGKARHADRDRRRLGGALRPPAGSTGRSTTCCSRSITGSSTTRATDVLSAVRGPTGSTVSTRPVSSPSPSACRERMRDARHPPPPLPYRPQNGGDYLIPSMQLRPELGDPGTAGFRASPERAQAQPASGEISSTKAS